MPRSERGHFHIMFICLGNICRSPLAEGIFHQLLEQRGLQSRYRVASAGTGNWHVGEPADSRMIATAKRYGINLRGCAQQVRQLDFERFDMLIAMDQSNYAHLLHLARDEAERARIRLLREFDPQADSDLDVPDPYYGGEEGFESVYSIVLRACASLLSALEDE